MMKRGLRVRVKSVVHETPTLYNSTQMQKYIESEKGRKNWIYKIISGEKEKEHIVFQDKNYIILPDTETLPETPVLNWMVVFTDLQLASIRDLRKKHIEILETVLTEIGKIVPNEFENPMIYFHYPPSVWQLHLHIAAPCDVLRTTNSMQKVYFLEDIISNLKIDGDFYEKNTLTYILPSTHEICTFDQLYPPRHAQKIEA